jgi:DNA helicase HerA-like ATPase
LGSTGVGKTTSVSLLLKKSLATRPKLRIIIFDPHNEYTAHFPGLAQIVDSESLELPFWMFKFDELADVVFSNRQPHPDERDALYEVIRIARAKYQAELGSLAGTSAVRRQPVAEGSSVTSDAPSPYRIIDVIAIIEEWLGLLDQRFPRSDLRALRHRLEGLNRDPRYRFMFGRLVVEDDIAKVISRLFRIPTRGLPVTIVRLAGLPNEVTNSVVSVLARLAFEIAFWCSGTYEINVLCEEAHRYISSSSGQAFGPARLAIGRIAKEGRKYGASLGVVTQRPSELDPTVLSQCSTMFAMRLANELDKGIIRAAAGVSAGSTIAFLSSIADREAIAFGEAIATPMRMKFADISACAEYRQAHVSGERDSDPIDLKKLSAQLRGEAMA